MRACASELINIGSARDSGRPFTRKISSTAARFTGSAASAYSVSVGTATTAPRLSHEAAYRIVLSSGFRGSTFNTSADKISTPPAILFPAHVVAELQIGAIAI